MSCAGHLAAGCVLLLHIPAKYRQVHVRAHAWCLQRCALWLFAAYLEICTVRQQGTKLGVEVIPAFLVAPIFLQAPGFQYQLLQAYIGRIREVKSHLPSMLH